MAKLIRLYSTASSQSTSQSTAIMTALMKLLLSGETDPAVYAADAACGSYFTTMAMKIDAYGDLATRNTIVAVDSQSFDVVTPGFKIRTVMYSYSGSVQEVSLIPYTGDTPVGYFGASSSDGGSFLRNTSAFSSKYCHSAHALFTATRPTNRFTGQGQTINFDIMVYIDDGFLAFGDIGIGTGANYEVGGTASKACHASLWKKRNDGTFIAVSLANQVGGAEYSPGYSRMWPFVLECATQRNNYFPSTLMVGGIPVYTDLVGYSQTFALTVAGTKYENCILPSYIIGTPTVKPVYKLGVFCPEYEEDLSNSGKIQALGMGSPSEFTDTITDGGVTYRVLGGILLINI